MLTLIFTLADATHKFKSPIKFSPQIFDVAGLPLPRPGCTRSSCQKHRGFTGRMFRIFAGLNGSFVQCGTEKTISAFQSNRLKFTDLVVCRYLFLHSKSVHFIYGL